VFRNGKFEREIRYKLFSDTTLRNVVLGRLAAQLVETGACKPNPKVRLCLAAGKIAHKTDRNGLVAHFCDQKPEWQLFDPEWIRERLILASKRGYEIDLAFVVSKLLLRNFVGLEKAITSAKTSQSLRD
jgi:hypothetical protein